MIIEAKSNYEKARRMGLRTVNKYKANGWNANLPSLDAILARTPIMSEVSLGLTEIPIKKIKGTRTNARRSAFAPDFMPILAPDTEFGVKWINLHVAHEEEGIREPIKVYEYLNWYYVEEGNKRVSVLKFHDAALISAYVTRLIPRYDKDDENIVIYYEFLDYYKKTGMNFLYFTEVGSFVKMYKWVEKYGWDKPENEGDLRIIYYRFRKLFKKMGGSKIEITTGDAFLKYLDVYTMHEGEEYELEKNLKNLWDEFEIVGEEESFELELAPSKEVKKSLFAGLTSFGSAMKTAKIAFVHAKSKDESVWTYNHEIGRMHIENVFEGAVTTYAINGTPEDDGAYTCIQKVAEKDFDVIFTTSPTFIHETLKASMEYEHIKFLNCSENLSYRHLRTYFGRIFEPNYLVGMIAGAMTKTHKLGYVVTYPIPEVISSINAFALGARFMNPYAEVYVKWVDEDEDHQSECFSIDQQLIGMGADIICHQESTDLKSSLNSTGIYFADEINKESFKSSLATPIWNWGIFYEKIIRNIMSGNYSKINGLLGSGDRAISYWWGMDAGVVDIMYSSSKVPEPLQKSVEFMKKMIIDGVHHPFNGPICDQKGLTRVDEGRHLTSEEIMTMDWFVKGVIGTIPSINAKDDNHPLLELFSVKKKY